MAFFREPLRAWLERLEVIADAAGNGNVGSPGSTTLRAIARWGNTLGTLLSDSAVLITDEGSIELPNGETVDGVDVSVLGSNMSSHLSDSANPHAVTKTQVGLSAVTNDVQLKRADNDWAGFTSKATPIGADTVLIEDSAASGAKKKTTVTALGAAGAAYAESAQALVSTNISTSSTSYADMSGATITMTLSAGDVLLISANATGSNASGKTFIQLVVDGVAVAATTTNINGFDNIAIVWRAAGLSAGSRVVKLQWKVDTGTATCNVVAAPDTNHCVLIVERVRV